MSSNESAEVFDSIGEKILEIMQVYPKISPTMLQAALGPSLPPKIWRPSLQDLIDQGYISQRAEFPPSESQRTRPFNILELIKTDISGIRVPPKPKATTVVIEQGKPAIAVPALT